MDRRAWRSELETTYHLRTLGASRVEGPTVWIAAQRNGEACEACQ